MLRELSLGKGFFRDARCRCRFSGAFGPLHHLDAVRGDNIIGSATVAVIFLPAGEVAEAADIVNNPVPGTVARVVSTDVKSLTTLAPAGNADVFVTGAQDIAGLSAEGIAVRLGIEPSSSYHVIEFPTPVGIASLVFRDNPGFVGQGLISGGAREFVIPNGPIPPNAIIKVVH